MTSTVIAKHNEQNDEFCLGMIVEHEDDGLDVLHAMRLAAQEYCKTEAGQAEIQNNGGNFNWGDFVNTVPNEICKKYGFKLVDTFITEQIVDHNETLIPED